MATSEKSGSSRGDDLIPHIIDRVASESPHKIYGLWPVDSFSYEAGFRTITYADFANVINGLSWWIEKHLGQSKNCEVLTYIGPNDVRYAALTLAAVKTGYVLFFTSPRNSPTAHRALFKSLQCRTLLTTDPTAPPATVVIEAVAPRKLAIPNLDELLGEIHPFYAYKKTFEEARDDPLMIIHTSGSTGLPKPLIWTHETAARHYNLSTCEPPHGVQSVERFCTGKRIMVTLPPFHGAGVTSYLFHPIALNTIPVAPAARGIVTAQGLLEALEQTPAEIGLLVPSVVAELAQDPALLKACAQYLKLIIYIGGDLPQALGDKVVSMIPLRCQWGASEIGLPQQLMPPELMPTDWRYIRLHPSLGAVFEEAADGLYEAVIQRRQELASTQAVFGVRGQDQLEKEYRTRDFFAKHPSIPDTWCWKARADDIIVFLNGEKTNPISMEHQIVAKNPELISALVIGSQRFQAGLLIEPAEPAKFKTTEEQAALIECVWPSVDEANRLAPVHASVEKPFILVTTEDRPMIRTGKGTIQRITTIARYTSEIDKMYMDAELTVIDDEAGNPVDHSDIDAITSLLRDIIRSVTKWPALRDKDSFFDHGLDSLQALQITRAVRRALHRPAFAVSTIYKNPTVQELAVAILECNSDRDDSDLMASLLSTYSGLIKQIPVPTNLTSARGGPVDVLLTGSTGYLGTYLLHSFLNRPDIGHLYCLNRGADGGHAVQLERLAAAGVPTDDLERRVIFLKSDLAHPSLGLNSENYGMLQAQIGLIVHNAWPVNFNLELRAFRPQLAGVVNLCALSASGPRAVPILFISSVAAAGLSADGHPAPEAISASLSRPYPQGYAQSKFLAELLCNLAAEYLRIPVAVARVGQIAGPIQRRGLWNPSEWLPSLLRSSIYLRCLPDNLGAHFTQIDWIPSDVLAEVIVDIVTSINWQGASSAQVFNLRNPATTTWDKLVPTIQQAAQEYQGQSLEVVSPSIWVERLQQSMTAMISNDGMRELTIAAKENPALRLLEFYRNSVWATVPHSPPMAVEHSVEASPLLQKLPAVGPNWMRKWIDEWMAHAN